MGDIMVSKGTPALIDSKNISKRSEESDQFSIENINRILDSGRQILNELSMAVKSCENIESLGAIGKLFSFVFEKETREYLWTLGGETKRVLYQPAFAAVVQYQSWVLDCIEIFHEMNDSRVNLFRALFQELDSTFSNIYQVLTVFERQIKIVQSLAEKPPFNVVEEVRGTIPKNRVVLYIVSCFFLNILCFPFVGFGIIGLIGVEVSILFGFPSLLQSVTRRKTKNTPMAEVKE